jgi:hypothetical protein
MSTLSLRSHFLSPTSPPKLDSSKTLIFFTSFNENANRFAFFKGTSTRPRIVCSSSSKDASSDNNPRFYYYYYYLFALNFIFFIQMFRLFQFDCRENVGKTSMTL